MKHLLYTIIFLFTCNLSAMSLDALLDAVTSDTLALQKEDKAREKRFLSDLDAAKKQLSDAKAALEQEKAKTSRLKEQFENQKAALDKYTRELEQKGENLKDVFLISKQEARDLSSLLETSMTSAQFKGRDTFLESIAISRDNPSIETLRTFWMRYLEEIVESGKIATFETPVVTTQGTHSSETVTRIGLFSAFDATSYLRYDDTLQEFVQLMRQPGSKYMEYISGYRNDAVVPALIDPTRGVLFSMLKEKATVSERIDQGGIIGYIILTLGAAILLFALFKYIMLQRMQSQIARQKHSTEILENNPLGNLLKAFEKHQNKEIAVIESKIDSALIKEIPAIQSGLPMIKLIAAVAPLLGLLGTVTGMIETFQSITLFGTGDPKLMAGGISQALMTTVLGLVVAIPVLFIYNILHAKSKKIIEVLTQQSSAVIARHLEFLHVSDAEYKQPHE